MDQRDIAGFTSQAFLDLTDWSVSEAAANDLGELTETVTLCMSF